MRCSAYRPSRVLLDATWGILIHFQSSPDLCVPHYFYFATTLMDWLFYWTVLTATFSGTTSILVIWEVPAIGSQEKTSSRPPPTAMPLHSLFFSVTSTSVSVVMAVARHTNFKMKNLSLKSTAMVNYKARKNWSGSREPDVVCQHYFCRCRTGSRWGWRKTRVCQSGGTGYRGLFMIELSRWSYGRKCIKFSFFRSCLRQTCLNACCVQTCCGPFQCANRAIKITMGSGIPSSNSKIERMVVSVWMD